MTQTYWAPRTQDRQKPCSTSHWGRFRSTIFGNLLPTGYKKAKRSNTSGTCIGWAPLNTEEDKQREEFLEKDTSSFANTVGGHLIVGMAAEAGVPTDIVGATIDDPDNEKSRLHQLADEWLEPRISFDIQAIATAEPHKHVLVIRILQSLNVTGLYTKDGLGNSGQGTLEERIAWIRRSCEGLSRFRRQFTSKSKGFVSVAPNR